MRYERFRGRHAQRHCGELATAKTRPLVTELVFTGLIDEEQAQAGSRALARSGFKANLAIVGEPTRCRAVTAHKGSLWLQIETLGRAAHGATPHLGKNAVHTMAQVVDVLETDYATQLKRRKHQLLGTGTVNVGMIAGGRQPNIVPGHCLISIDRRTLPGETETGVSREIMALLAEEKAGGENLPISSWRHPCHWRPMLKITIDTAVFPKHRPVKAAGGELFLRCGGAVGRRHPEHRFRAGRHRPGTYDG